jgi:hypothetical protein
MSQFCGFETRPRGPYRPPDDPPLQGRNPRQPYPPDFRPVFGNPKKGPHPSPATVMRMLREHDEKAAAAGANRTMT